MKFILLFFFSVLKPLILDVELFDIPLTKETIGEITRAYLELDQKKTVTKQGGINIGNYYRSASFLSYLPRPSCK